MKPRARPGVSAYIEVFVLTAVAIGGAGLVFGGAAPYIAGLSGPSLSVGSAYIRQGTYAAIESVTVSDGGATPLGNIVVTTSQPPAAPYCYMILQPSNGTVLASTCPTLSSDPGSVPVAPPAGCRSFVLELVIGGAGFELGSVHQITAISTDGAQGTASAVVSPA